MAKPGLHLISVCENCGNAYRQSRSDQKCCSPKCTRQSWGRRNRLYVEIECEHCGVVVEKIHSQQIYCSKRCEEKSRNARRRNGIGKGGLTRGLKLVVHDPDTICYGCGELFYKPDYYKRRGHKLNFCTNSCRTEYMAQHPEYFPQTKNKRGRGGKREDLGGLFVRSTWEANWARYLNWLISVGEINKWEYEVDTFEFDKIKRGSRFYTPDFKVTNLDGSVEYHEVKGYMDQRSETKLKRMHKYYPGIKIILVDKVQYYAMARQMSALIPEWEHPHSRRYGTALSIVEEALIMEV